MAATSAPTQVPGLTGVTSIATGATTAYALAGDGRIWAWGANTYGQLGDGTTTARTTPALIPRLPAIRNVSTSGFHTLAAAVDGSVWAWGNNSADQIGDVTSQSDRLVPLPILQDTTLGTVPTETPGTLDPANDVVRYYHTDAIGSVRVVTDPNGQVVERHDYKPFGEEWNPPPSAQPRRFTGQERDSETGLDYFGARYYANGSGRFTSVDPVLNIKSASLDPQRWNRYSYAWNRPLAMVDPDGREAGYIYLPNGRMLSPYDAGFPRSLHPISDTAALAAPFVLGGFFAAAIDTVAIAGPAIFDAAARLLSTPQVQAMPTRRDQLLGIAKDPGLRDAIDNLFRSTAKIGDGSSMAAYAHELATGQLLSRTGHGQKLIDRLGQLDKLLQRRDLLTSDRAIAQQLANEIRRLLE